MVQMKIIVVFYLIIENNFIYDLNFILKENGVVKFLWKSNNPIDNNFQISVYNE